MTDIGTWTGVGQKPSLASVVVIGDLARATFSEPMTNNADFIDPANYVFAALNPLSVAVIVSHIYPGPGIHPTYVDISLSKSFTFGTNNYSLTVDSSLVDEAGNAMNPAGLSKTFNGSGIRATITVTPYQANLEKLRVNYSKLVKQVNQANLDDALHVANYSISGGVTVSSALSVSAQVVELQVAGQQYGHSYTLTVADVEDLSNNEVAP